LVKGSQRNDCPVTGDGDLGNFKLFFSGNGDFKKNSRLTYCWRIGKRQQHTRSALQPWQFLLGFVFRRFVGLDVTN
jgi:hypothetical protein